MKILTRRNGKVIKTYTDEEPVQYGAPVKRVVTRKNRWLEAETLAHPKRKDLSKRQWQEYGDSLKIVRAVGFTNARKLSLQDLRDVRESITRCQLLRITQ